jgi:hypothetical protein
MDPRLSLHVESWLNALLREKAMQTPRENQPCLIDASEFATMLCNYVLETLADDPRRCGDACGFNNATDEEILGMTGFDRELLAAAFIGAVVELSPWLGDEGAAFLQTNGGVSEEDARSFSQAAELVCEELGTRGRALLPGKTAGLKWPAPRPRRSYAAATISEP